jgi:hypothetical protein
MSTCIVYESQSYATGIINMLAKIQNSQDFQPKIPKIFNLRVIFYNFPSTSSLASHLTILIIPANFFLSLEIGLFNWLELVVIQKSQGSDCFPGSSLFIVTNDSYTAFIV